VRRPAGFGSTTSSAATAAFDPHVHAGSHVVRRQQDVAAAFVPDTNALPCGTESELFTVARFVPRAYVERHWSRADDP
jgi:hypothetical protein